MKIRLFFSLILIFYGYSSIAEVILPKLISNGMVLQRNAEVSIWGWADPGEDISIEFQGHVYNSITDDGGKWSIQMLNLETGGPYKMIIQGKNKIFLDNLLVGDVWVCSGQSNMELPMRRVRPLYEEEIRTANRPLIHYFEVPKTYHFNQEKEDLTAGKWVEVNTENILSMSALSFFFAEELFQRYQVPIGVINSALGGSPAESWLSEEALKSFPVHYDELQKFKDPNTIQSIQESDRNRITNWYHESTVKDLGNQNHPKWNETDLSDDDWSVMKIPGYWENSNIGNVNGVVWFRKNFTLNEDLAGESARLELGRIVDADSVWVNGYFIGRTTYQYPPRWYTIPKGILKSGENTIAIRVVNESGRGGFVSDKNYEIEIDGQKTSLEGEWKFKLGISMPLLKSQTFIRWKPAGLFNAMISPLLKYTIKGVIWYQGESNVSRPAEYELLFQALINEWRKRWNQGDFPFLYVQLPNFLEPDKNPAESNWAEFRNSQTKALKLKNTGMAVAIDLGEWNDIHPLNKKDVAYRLALCAWKIAYGEKELVSSGPMYRSHKIKGNKIEISFENVGSGLICKGDTQLNHFAIAGKDNKYVWANARIKGNKIIVWHKQVSNPVSVRYAWANNPESANLYNKEGLPASPFTTQD